MLRRAHPPCAGTRPHWSDAPYFDAAFAQHGFLRNANGSAITLSALGALAAQPEASNAEGAFAGYHVDANGVCHGLLRREE